MMTLDEKFSNLKKDLKSMERVLIAYSGGVDSTFLLKAASVSGLDKVLAVTGVSDSLPEEEALFAKETAELFGMDLRTITTEELKNSAYAENPPDRCYHCKKELFGRLKNIAREEGLSYVLDGTNADDADDWRPGMKAASEEGVASPLLKAGLGKDEIRSLSRELGLSTWDKPATPCLASRFPYGHKITSEALNRVHNAEKFIRSAGIKELRVRAHSDVARIEVLPGDITKLTKGPFREEVVEYLKSLGFKYVTIDLQGFRSGSSNEVL